MVPRLYISMTVLSLTIIAVTCQSFQYSNGWMNGKRSDMTRSNVYQPSESKLHYETTRKLSEKTFFPAVIHCDLQKLRTLLQGNNNDKFYLLPCGLLNIPQRATDFSKALNQLL